MCGSKSNIKENIKTRDDNYCGIVAICIVVMALNAPSELSPSSPPSPGNQTLWVAYTSSTDVFMDWGSAI